MITSDNFPKSVRVDLDIAYKEGREAATDSAYRQLIEVVPTSSTAKDEVFYGDKGTLRRFRGERKPQQFNEYKQTITLDDWELTRTIKRQVLSDDQSGGLLRKKVKNFGLEVETSLEAETYNFLRRGVSIKGFDNSMFFDTGHAYQDSSGSTHGTGWNNVHRGGSQIAVSTLQRTQKHFVSVLSDTNKPLGMRLTHVLVKRGTDNATSAKEISNSQFTVEVSTAKGANTVNTLNGSFGILECDYGLGDTEWMAFDLSKPDMLPIKVLSHSIDPGFSNLEFTQLLEDSETGFWRNEFAFGVWGRFDWNPGDPRSAYLHGASSWTETPDDLGSVRVLYPNA